MTYLSPEALLEDVQLTLENDGRWYRWCNRRYRGDLELIDGTHWRNALRYFYHPAIDLDTDQRNYLRKYFKWRYQTGQKGPPPAFPGAPAPLVSLTAIPTEKPVSTKLTFRPQFLLNGAPLETFSKDAVYEAIAAEEKRIAKLREIEHRPNSLITEIEQSEAMLQALVSHLDSI
jgi:hypothetical protein